MIDITSESVVSFAEAAASLPRRRGNRSVHVSTIHRWARRGCRGVRLEFIQVGGTMCTSQEALQRFFAKLTQHHEAETVVPAEKPGAAGNAAVARALDREGL